MEPTKRIVINALSQYVRTAVCMLLALYSTRLVLALLGQQDFGIYALVGNVVALVAFVTSSLSVSTQRFLSYSWGRGGMSEVRSIFANAMFLHIAISVVLVVSLLAVEHPVVHSWLRIAEERRAAADFVYYMMLVILGMTFLTAPVKGLFIARENIVFASAIDILDAVVKLLGVIALTCVTADTLRAYALLMAGISVLSFAAYATYGLLRYDECHVPRLSELSRATLRRMMGFATWNIYAVGSTVARSQGLAVIFNRFFGLVVNAAYGIALQVSAALSSVAASVINAVNPQLMKAEGRGDRQSMLHYATLESKYSFLALATLLLPVLVELPLVLHAWLGDYPSYAPEMCSYIIVIVLLDQLTIGLTSANQAVGQIRNYSLLVSTVRLSVLPLAWLCMHCGMSAGAGMLVYLLVEIVCGIIRVPFLVHTAGLDAADYLRRVVACSALPVCGCLGVSLLVAHTCGGQYRFLLTEVVGASASVALIYMFSLTPAERQWVLGRLLTLRKSLCSISLHRST